MRRPVVIRMLSALGAAGLVALSGVLPLWSMTMRAPQYRNGLKLSAYGTGMVGDLRELNILNHYIGMPPIEAPAFETSIFPYGIAALILLCLLAPLHRWLWRIALTATALTPLIVLGDLQWRLYQFGHSLDPHAPIRLKPFTPLAIGSSKMGNFESTAIISTGVLCLIAAAVLLAIGSRIAFRYDTLKAAPAIAGRTAMAAMLGTLLALTPQAGEAATLQTRLDAAPRGSTVIVDGGYHQGPIVIRGPLTVVGRNRPVIDGGGVGSVVTIQGDDVTFRGFIVQNSGREVTEEAAGIKVDGSRLTIEDNDIHDVYFGIHIGGGSDQVVRHNRIAPGERHGARPGHGISVWHSTATRLLANSISDARDGIYLSFTEGVVADSNEVTGCRYGMHSMYSQNATFAGNTLKANLLGTALMMSDRLVLRGNRIEQHRRGSAAYGVLLKDIGDLTAADNIIIANRVGIYAEGVPSQPARLAILTGNVIAGNEVGLMLQSNAALTVSGNRIAENLTDVRPLGRQLSAATRWTKNGVGNSWGQYRGYDADGDGIGDVPYRVDDAMDGLIRKSPLARAFLYTPAHLALEAAVRMFPLYRQAPVLIDDRPLMGAGTRGSR